MGSRHQSLVPVSLSLHLHHSPSGDDHHNVGESSVTAQSEACSQMSNAAQAVFICIWLLPAQPEGVQVDLRRLHGLPKGSP